MATMKDVAELARVSIAIVSRVLNDDRSLSIPDSTRKRVIEAANQLNYQVKKRRQKSVLKSLKKVAIVDFHPEDQERDDPYFWPMVQGIELECQEQGLPHPSKIYVKSADEFDPLELSQYDGVLVIGAEEWSGWEGVRHPGLIFLDHCPNPDEYPSVVLNFAAAVRQVFSHFWKLGYREFGYIGGLRLFGMDEREATFRACVKSALGSEPAVAHGDWSTSGGYEAMRALLESDIALPRAIFAASDPMAIGAIRALAEAGKKVPEDVAVVGFDDIEVAPYVNPALTTVRVQPELMGRIGVRMLLHPYDDEVPLQVVMPYRLVVRESCGAYESVPALGGV
ncbi:LacI family DNA-binding transcriptional regulator [Alicyclobacillus vulcanalis]|uniref:Transcriptional regulator, LacI family n=1 Tax=Alicyclobacillus vulcanalis TaxID=252246 RepID=A0A1N7N6B8_9BACL|nr:LacI family DNA-binding transcriptional regulator [Alicyclobacillus vulcanalis]SIS93798.1 transcriptional regulator, LacI family [Alicyclobacillus vulcanalis]